MTTACVIVRTPRPRTGSVILRAPRGRGDAYDTSNAFQRMGVAQFRDLLGNEDVEGPSAGDRMVRGMEKIKMKHDGSNCDWD